MLGEIKKMRNDEDKIMELYQKGLPIENIVTEILGIRKSNSAMLIEVNPNKRNEVRQKVENTIIKHLRRKSS